MRRGRPRGLKAVPGAGVVALEAQVEQIGLWEDGAGQRAATELPNQWRFSCAAVTNLRDDTARRKRESGPW